MNQTPITLSILLTTIDSGIEKVISNMLAQFSQFDEIIVSHQITDEKWIQNNCTWPKNVKYIYEYSQWLSRNRNHALSHASSDICYICDDDIILKKWFKEIILWSYMAFPHRDVISFEAENTLWKKRFWLKWWKHNFLSFLKISSVGITFRRDTIIKKQIYFNEKFGLWTKYPIWEEALFLGECYKKSCVMIHDNTSIVVHPDDSTGKHYSKELARARIILWKELFGFFGGVFACMYFWVSHYRLYKKSLWAQKTWRIFIRALFTKKV